MDPSSNVTLSELTMIISDDNSSISNGSIDSGDNPSSYHLNGLDKVVLAVHGIIFLLALVGNGLVIATLVQNKRMRTVTNIFLLNLAICDLLLAIVCMPFTVIPVVLRDFMFGPIMCSLIRYLQGMSVSASAFTLVAISLERFFAICNPLKSRKWQHLTHSYKVIAAIWVTAMVLNIPLAIFQKLVTYEGGSSGCTDIWPDNLEDAKTAYYFFHLLIADLLVPLTIMSIAYGLIAQTLWNGFKAMHVVATTEPIVAKAKRQMSLASDVSDDSDETEVTFINNLASPTSLMTPNGMLLSPTDSDPYKFTFSNGSGSQKFLKRSFSRQETAVSLRSHSSQSTIRSKKRVIKMLFVIVLEFFICWTPLYVMYIWIMEDRDAILKLPNPTLTLTMMRVLAYISSCCNPITYCFMSKKFRVAFLTAFRCRKEPKPFKRRLTLQSTQVSYCDTPQHARGKLQLPVLNGHNKPQLSVLAEISSERGV